jgi:two-component system, sensor histidine kinase and response regulator
MAPRILLLCDDPRDLQLTWLALRRAGLKLDGAQSLPDALALLRSTRYAAAVVDCRNWPSQGLEAVRQLRATLGVQGPPVLGISAHAAEADGEQALAAGCDYYLTKPLDVTRLGRLVADLARAPE